MKKIKILIFFFALFYSIPAYTGSADILSLENLPMPPLKEPQVIEGELKNGMRYYLLEDHQIPVVDLGIIVKVGEIYEEPEKLGLTTLLSRSIRIGGTKSKPPEVVDRILDDNAAKITENMGDEMGVFALQVLSKDFKKVIPLFFEMIFEPGFDPSRVALAKANIIEGLKREADFPEVVAAKEFKKLIYGQMSPWAWTPTDKTIKNISIENLREVHKKYFTPENVILVASGDFGRMGFLSAVKKSTKRFSKGAVSFPDVQAVKLEFGEKTRLFKKDLTQSYINVGHLATKRHNPDNYALMVMNIILGGAPFKSRLMQDIRSDRGLAYNVSSSFGVGADYGLFEVDVYTKAISTKEVLRLIKKHIRDMAVKGDIREDEVLFAKNYLLNSLIFDFDNSYKIVFNRARFYLFGYPDDYWRVFRENIERVTLDDVKRVARTYLHPEGLATVIVGPAGIN